MFENSILFYLCGFLSLLFGFRILEFQKNNLGSPSPKIFFPAILAVVGAVQFQHFRSYGSLESMGWWSFIFLASSPFLGILLFRPKAIRSVLKVLSSLLVWIVSFWWITHTVALAKQHVAMVSLIPAGIFLFPWKKVWKSWRCHQTERQRRQAEMLKAERLQQQETQKLAQEQENEVLLRELIRDLGK